MDAALRHRINAGRVALRAQTEFFHHHFGQLPSAWKEDQTRVTFADFAISERIAAALRQSFPEDDFCSEEDAPADEERELSARFAWVIDPIDGTNNYALGLPFCAISLALLRNGRPVYGFLYDLGRRSLLQGGPQQGAFDGCTRLRLHATATEPNGVLGLGFPVSPEVGSRLTPWLSRWRVRSLGSSALQLAYVATGLFDGSLDTRAKVWDLAAAVAIVRGAGGTFQPLGEDPFPLRRFSSRAPSIPYVAGGPAMMAQWQELFGPFPASP